jgi:glycosyltransferase involved in cell wall biosynthesis
MKIAFFNKHLPSDHPNGVSVQVHYLANALVELGYRVTCFSFSPAPEDSLYESNRFFWNSKWPLLRKFIPALKFRSIKSDDFDIMHYHGDDYLCPKNPSRVRTFYGSALQEAIHAATLSRFLYQALFYFFEWISCFKQGKLVGISVNTTRSLPLVKKVIPCGVPLHLFSPAPSVKTSYPSILS